MVEWSGARSCHRFQIALLENSVFKSLHSGERFLLAPFSVIVFGVVVWTSKTAPFSFENGLVWTGPETQL